MVAIGDIVPALGLTVASSCAMTSGSSTPPLALRIWGILAPDAQRLFGSPEAHGRAEGDIHEAFAAAGPVAAECYLDYSGRPSRVL